MRDLMDFDGQEMYFDEPLGADVKALLDDAAADYEKGEGEAPLLAARQSAPNSLTVLVALYRFYYYRHRYSDAVDAGYAAYGVAARSLGISEDWRALSAHGLSNSNKDSVALVRFLLLALKGVGFLYLRMGEPEKARLRLAKVLEMDTHDRLGARALIGFAGDKADRAGERDGQTGETKRSAAR